MASRQELSALARDHLDHPRNGSAFSPRMPGRTVCGEAGSASSGALVRFYLRIADGRILAARHEVLGPPELMAAASWMTERLAGLEAVPAAVPTGLETARALDLPRPAHGLALLVEDAVLACLKAGET